MEPDITPLENQDVFRFRCGDHVPCFNHCCRDLNQALSPYDIVRLKNGLGMDSTTFLEKYTRTAEDEQSGLPVVSLIPADDSFRTCPFVTPQGCRVYAFRPSSCRMYPLMRMASRNRETGLVTHRYFLLKEAHCRGFETSREQTVEQWVATQGLSPYNRINDRMLALVSVIRRLSRPLSLAEERMFFIAVYDQDYFETHYLDNGRLNGLYTPERLDAARADKEELLLLGMDWVAGRLAGGPDESRMNPG